MINLIAYLMRKIKYILLVFLLFLFSFSLFINLFWPPKAGIVVSSNPSSVVFINDNKVGKTPFEGMFDPGEVVVKLVSDGSGEFETRVNLVAGVRTIVQRQFSSGNNDSAGFIGTFEKSDSRKTLVSIVSVPESAQVLIDGQFRGTTPLFLDDVAPGKHELTVMATDYIGKTVSARFYKGYKFIAFFEIAPRTSLGVTRKKSEEYVQLKEKVQGKEKPSENSKVLHDLEKDTDYLVLEKSEDKKWYKLKVSDDAVWVESSFIKD